MKKTDIIIHFHNPNTAEAMAIFFLKTVVKANAKQIEKNILHSISAKEPPHNAIYNIKG